MPSRILIIEDDPDTTELIRLYLVRDGHQVLTASDGVQGLRLAQEDAPDLIVLDLMLPRMDGLEVCRRVRQISQTPIIMLTARVEEEDRLGGLDMGADDYVTKPFTPRELAARVRAVLRRAARDAMDRGPSFISYEGINVDVKSQQTSIDGALLSLTRTEFRLLVTFLREPGRVFSREEIISRVYGYDFEGFDRAVDSHVHNLRRKLNTASGDLRYIHTAYGSGYRFGDA